MSVRIGVRARAPLERDGSSGTLATVSAGGAPHQAVVWSLVHGDTIIRPTRIVEHPDA